MRGGKRGLVSRLTRQECCQTGCNFVVSGGRAKREGTRAVEGWMGAVAGEEEADQAGEEARAVRPTLWSGDLARWRGLES